MAGFRSRGVGRMREMVSAHIDPCGFAVHLIIGEIGIAGVETLGGLGPGEGDARTMDAGPVGLTLVMGDVNAERALSQAVRGNKDGGKPNYTEKPKEASAMRNISTAHEGNSGTRGGRVQTGK